MTDDDKLKIEELTNNWKRALADYQNLEKNYAVQRISLSIYLKKEIILKLLPVLENLEKADEHLKDKGLSLAIGQFMDVLRKEGLEEVEILGKKFDPNFAECVEIENGKEDDVVVKVLSKGYKLMGEIILPAKVKVSKKEVK